MRFAIDKNGKRVCIENVDDNQDYFCPICGQKLVLKRGKIVVHHFAHLPNSQCHDSWHYDMSDWHMRWQSRFPLDTQEIVKVKDGQKHRADVLLEDKKVVYEFQHSPLSPEEFEDRNRFYNSLGYKVIWIFDLSEQFDTENIYNYKNNLYKWIRPKRTFDNFTIKEYPNVELYFQIQVSGEENEMVRYCKSRFEIDHEIYFEDQRRYYEDHKDDTIELIKITWVSDSGFEIFASDGRAYDEKDIVSRFLKTNETKDDKILLGKLTDFLIEMYSEDHTTYYFGCPRSSTHLCGNTNIDISNSKYNEIYLCTECEFSVHDNHGNPMCKKRFKDLGLSDNTQVEIIEKNNDGFISKLAYFDSNKRCILDLPVFPNQYKKSIYALWDENNYKVAIFKNVKTGGFVKFNKNPLEQKYSFGKVYGYFSYDQYSYKNTRSEIYGCEKPEWICVWYIKKE